MIQCKNEKKNIMVKKSLKSLFRFFGLEIKKVRPEHVQYRNTMQHGLHRMKQKGINPSTIIDLGAAQGTWSLTAMNFWPDAKYLLFEPLSERKKELDDLKGLHKNVHVIYAAAGRKKGFVDFGVTDDLDGSGIFENHDPAKLRRIEVNTIDEEIRRIGLKPPFLIKFDTHGFEVPILDGAKSALRQTELIVMECYGFRISKNCLLLHEMCAYLDKLDFRLADVVDLMRRPGDEFFWQCDVFFLRSSHPSFQRNSYK